MVAIEATRVWSRFDTIILPGAEGERPPPACFTAHLAGAQENAMHVDTEIFAMVERIKQLMTDLEDADCLSDSSSLAAMEMANAAWRTASQGLNETANALAALEPESFPAMAAIADAAALTGSPTLIAALRDAPLRLAVRQAEAHELRRDRIENEPPTA
jgi:hypothetical protein